MSKRFILPFNPIIWPAVPHDYTGDYNLGYYATEATQRYVWGTRGMTWDGSVYRYSRAKDTLHAGRGAWNSANIDESDMLDTNHTQTIEIGDTSVLFTVTTPDTWNAEAIAEDELAGAKYVVGHGAGATTETRTVIGNDAIAASTTGTIMIYVDAPFAIKHTTGFNELPVNPYAYLWGPVNHSELIASVMGIPNVIAITGQNLWIQTWGLCFITPGGADSDIGSTVADRTVVFAGDGSVNGADILTARSYQSAGFITDASQTGSMPMVMLQISI